MNNKLQKLTKIIKNVMDNKNIIFNTLKKKAIEYYTTKEDPIDCDRFCIATCAYINTNAMIVNIVSNIYISALKNTKDIEEINIVKDTIAKLNTLDYPELKRELNSYQKDIRVNYHQLFKYVQELIDNFSNIIKNYEHNKVFDYDVDCDSETRRIKNHIIENLIVECSMKIQEAYY